MNAVADAGTGQTTTIGVAASPPDAATSRAAEVAAYLYAVRAALMDLEPGVRDGLLDDLPGHLSEVAAADSTPLRAHLGPPEAFAIELRSAAGLAPVGVATRQEPGVSATKLMRIWAIEVDRALGHVTGYDTLRELLVALRPAWWVARGALVATSVLLVTHILDVYYWPAPRIVLWVVFALFAAVLSIRYGRSSRGTVTRVAASIINVLCVPVLIYAVVTLHSAHP